MIERHPVSCNKDCGGGCPLIAVVDDGSLVKIIDNPDGPEDMRGCARGYHAIDELEATDRIQTPLIRTGPRGSGEFRETTWDEALDGVAESLGKIRDQYGSQSILGLAGSGSCRGAVHNTSRLTKRFLGLLGESGAEAQGYTGTRGGYSSAAQSFVLPFIFGRGDVGIDPLTLEESSLIILWGANVVDTRFGSDLETVLRRVHRRGVPIISIDPRRSRTVSTLSDEWIPIRPGTDALLMSAILKIMIEESSIDREFLDTYTSGWGEIESLLGTLDLAAAARVTGVELVTLRDLAGRYARARPTALVAGLSIQRTIGGEEAVRLAVALQAATGNIGIPGGAPGCNLWGLLPGPSFGRVEATIPPVRTVPVYQWPDAILDGPGPFTLGGDARGRGGQRGGERGGELGGDDEDSIRAVYIAGANYVVTGSDIEKNRRAFSRLDFAVCHDYRMTTTAIQCDVVLPTTTFLERNDVVFPAGNYLFYSRAVSTPVGAARNDYDIFADLASRLGIEEGFTEGKSASEWLEYFIEKSPIDDVPRFLTDGMFDGGDHRRIGLAGFVADPIGNALPTPDGKIALVSSEYARYGAPRVPEWRGVLDESGFPLKLATPHARYRINSQYGEADWAKKREPQALLMHPTDAAKRGIEDGDVVTVTSSIGSVPAIAHVSDDVMPGVLSLPAGAWPSESGEPSGAPNFVTSTAPTMPSEGARTHTVFVEVEASR